MVWNLEAPLCCPQQPLFFAKGVILEPKAYPKALVQDRKLVHIRCLGVEGIPQRVVLEPNARKYSYGSEGITHSAGRTPQAEGHIPNADGYHLVDE